MLFNNSDLYEYVSEGKKTREMNDVVKQYSQTIRELNKNIKNSLRDKDYNKAEKLLNDKKKIIRSLERSINDVDISGWDSLKGNLGFMVFELPSIIRVVNWSSKLGISSGDALYNGLSYTGMLMLAALLGSVVFMPHLGELVYQAYIKPDNMENLVDTAHTHPSKTNLLKVVDAAMKETENQIRHVKRLKSVKESYISAAIENYIDIVLEDAINDDFFNRG